MKTAMIYDQCGEDCIKYFVLDGDLSHLQGTYINNLHHLAEKQSELLEIMHGPMGCGELRKDNTREEFVQAIRDGAVMILCGFLP